MADSASGNAIQLPPFQSLWHGAVRHHSGTYWVTRRDERMANELPGHETALGLTRIDGSPATVESTALKIELTCTNRNLPNGLPVGPTGTNLELRDDALKCPIVLLTRPTESVRPTGLDSELWRIISFFTSHPIQINETGLDDLKRLFRLFSARPSSNSRHIDGIIRLRQRLTTQWINLPPAPSFMRGIEVTLTVNEQTFSSTSLSGFINVLDHFFGRYAPPNSFTQLVAISETTGTELMRCKPRPSYAMLI
jgi:type VI secretion system protein ImpG